MSRKFWIIFGLISVATSILFSYFPLLADKLYYKGAFQVIRVVYDYTLGWLPFPMIYIVFPLTIYLIYFLLGKAWKAIRTESALVALKEIILGFLAFVGFFYGMFYWLWGYNYSKPNFETNINLDVQQISSTQLFNELYRVHDQLAGIRPNFETNPDTLDEKLSQDLESKLRVTLEEFLVDNDYPTYGRVRIRKLKPKGTLLRISTAGVYIPFAIEGHFDAGLHPLTWPATLAHEMAHGYGFTDEGTCNFIGYQVCIDHEDPYIKYSGWLMYFRYLYRNARLADRTRFSNFSKQMSREVYNDLVDIDNYSRRYPDIMPKVRDAVYDSYLKSHGVKEGLRSYSRMILLVDAWNRKQGNDFQMQEGDLLFQDSDCGSFCDAIEAVTEGVEGYDFSHIGMIMKDKERSLKVMEAISEGVVLTPIDEFMDRSKDSLGNSKIIVGRLSSEYQKLVPAAISFINDKMDAEYDSWFDINNDKYYCSELIHLAFQETNGAPIFETPPMTFKKPETDSTYQIWTDYFRDLKSRIPEGEPGLNPGSMSRSEAVEIVYRYF